MMPLHELNCFRCMFNFYKGLFKKKLLTFSTKNQLFLEHFRRMCNKNDT